MFQMDTPDNSSSRYCSTYREQIMITVWAFSCVLLLPLFLFVVYIGFKKYKRSGNISHSDVFTFNIIADEIFSVIGLCFTAPGMYVGGYTLLLTVGMGLFDLNLIQQLLFHCLTCLDRYLAVVHPVFYLRLRKGHGVTFRNTTIAAAWLISVVHVSLLQVLQLTLYSTIAGILFSFLALAFVVFCCVSVLCVLIRPKPGDEGMTRKKTDKSKRTAFYTMLAILGVLLMRLLTEIFYYIIRLINIDMCVWAVSALWFGFPSSLLLPLLFLHRAGVTKGCVKRQAKQKTSHTAAVT